jgi:hypothetical protein
MKIVYSEQALSDLAEIHEYQKREWPGVGEKFDERLVEIEQCILTFPTGAAVVEKSTGRLRRTYPEISLSPLLRAKRRRRRDPSHSQHFAKALGG